MNALAIQDAALVAVSFLVATIGTRALIPLLRRWGCVDVPNGRSSHQTPTPRGGGLAVVAGIGAAWALGWWWNWPLPPIGVLAAVLAVALAGLADDLFDGISVGARLVVQFAAAVLVLLHVGSIPSLPLPPPLDLPLGSWSFPLTLLWIVAVTNIYNFLDGIDGFAATQGVLVGVALALVGGDSSMAVVGCAVAGSCLGFLRHNWSPARVFLGDVGSGALGFLLAIVPLLVPPAARSGITLTVALCLWVFLFDGAYTLLRRLTRRERFWRPHRSHLYQRLVASGLSHRRVVKVLMAGGGVLALLAVLARGAGWPSLAWPVIVVALAWSIGYVAWVHQRETRVRRRAGRKVQAGEPSPAPAAPAAWHLENTQ
jgi:UDP-N-acetylmuramyl pentapeptide phosphotransferase/UDP-N-acetylglucosamine-1-phosphate transferase